MEPTEVKVSLEELRKKARKKARKKWAGELTYFLMPCFSDPDPWDYTRLDAHILWEVAVRKAKKHETD